MVNRWACLLATGFGSGHVPVAPGTVGSLVGVLVYLFLIRFSTLPVSIFLAGCLFGVGVYVSGVAEKIFQEADARVINIDEILGMVLTLLMLPKQGYLIPAFILFRGFDILKPYPARLIEQRMRGGLAIMLDDVVAAGYTILILNGFDLFFG